MKRGLILLFFISFFVSCDKELVNYDIEQNPFKVFPTEFNQNVLLEAFTAEWIDNNVPASILLDSLYNNTNGLVIPIKMHDNDWLETGYTDYQYDYLGQYIQVLSGSVNRIPASSTQNGDDGSLLMDYENWGSNVTKALKNNPPITLALETEITANNTANIYVHIAQQATVDVFSRLQLYFTEDNIEPISQPGAGPSFRHNYIFKESYPDFVGRSIDLSRTENIGKVNTISFLNIPLDNFNLGQMRVIAFAYKANGTKEIINAQSCGIGGARIWQ